MTDMDPNLPAPPPAPERRPWTAPTASMHGIEIVEAVTGNFSHAADGGGSPCRS